MGWLKSTPCRCRVWGKYQAPYYIFSNLLKIQVNFLSYKKVFKYTVLQLGFHKWLKLPNLMYLMNASCPMDVYTSLPIFTTVSFTVCAPFSQSSFLSPHFTRIHHFSAPFDFMFLRASVSHLLQYLGTWGWRTKLLAVFRTGEPLSLSKQHRKVLVQSGEDSNFKLTFTILPQQLSDFSNLGKISP